MAKLVIVDNRDALGETLAAFLATRGVQVVGAVGTVAAGLNLVVRAEPDVALIDIELPDGSGIELTRELLGRRPKLGVILYTADTDADLLYGGLDSGARGYALKAGSMAELTDAIERVAAGGSYVDPRLDRMLLSPRATAQIPELSPRDREILHSLAEGRTPDSTVRKSLRARWSRLWRRFLR